MKSFWIKTYLYFTRKRNIRSSKILVFLLFGFFPKPRNRKTLWDSTSLVLKNALNSWVTDKSNVLEIGTGDIGLLSNYLVRIKDVNITAIDICPDFIINSQRNIRKRYKKVKFQTSNLFGSLKKTKFDYIFSNPPYVKTSMIDRVKHAKYHRFSKENMVFYASDGGEDGLKIINRIIKESKYYLNPKGSLILGYNENHIDKEKLRETIRDNNYYIFDTVHSHYSECKCLNLKSSEDA